MKSLPELAKSALWRCGYELRAWRPYRQPRGLNVASPYQERPEYGASNIESKQAMLQSGLPFEYPAIVNLNHAVVGMIGDAKRIGELGSGTGKFAVEAAQDSSRTIIASEFDTPTYEWCLATLPSLPNLTFVNGPIPSIRCPLDLAVCVEVIEHIHDYSSFLRDMASLAPRSLITTPNRARSATDWHAGPPHYEKHVREWTAGELYWVLRCFWKEVELYAMTDTHRIDVAPVDVDTHLSPLIADCRLPIH